MTTDTKTAQPENVTSFEDASNSRWLTARLGTIPARVKAEPTEDAVEHIRAQVFPNAEPRKKQRSIAA